MYLYSKMVSDICGFESTPCFIIELIMWCLQDTEKTVMGMTGVDLHVHVGGLGDLTFTLYLKGLSPG